VRLILTDGTERIIGAWGLTVLPKLGVDGHPLEVVLALELERRSIPNPE
jgi:hypothetical protein